MFSQLTSKSFALKNPSCASLFYAKFPQLTHIAIYLYRIRPIKKQTFNLPFLDDEDKDL